MRAARTDLNHAEIREGLRRIGATVADTSRVGRGFPDLVVGYMGRTVLLEIKSKGGKLKASQMDWFRDWRGEAYVVSSLEQALRVLTAGVER